MMKNKKKKIQQQAKFRQVALNLEKDTEAAYDFCFLDEFFQNHRESFIFKQPTLRCNDYIGKWKMYCNQLPST